MVSHKKSAQQALGYPFNMHFAILLSYIHHRILFYITTLYTVREIAAAWTIHKYQSEVRTFGHRIIIQLNECSQRSLL